MKKLVYLSILAFALALPAFAADQKIEGEAVCAKCELKEAKACATAIKVTKDGKTETYYAENNDVAKAFHKNVCHDSAKVTAEGDVSEKDGKKVITLTKIDVAH
jgi:Family of unknown function (DUF6370)